MVVGPKNRTRIYQAIGKRAFDLTLALALTPVWLPLGALVALLVKSLGGSPVLFRQERPGRLGTPFTILKFRTMREIRDSEVGVLDDEARLTSLGRLLRRTSMDELPELLNVFRGEMSLVGPRPLLMQYLDRYSTEQARRHEVLPGITGWAQVNGRNALTWQEKFELDVWYVDNMSLGLDLKILGLTVWKTLTGEGLSAPDHATMREFMGTQDE